MCTTQPLRQDEDIKRLKDYFLEKGEHRNYFLVTLGLNSALRISDILSLKWDDIYLFDKQCFRKHITLIEKKTQKRTQVLINQSIIYAAALYLEHIPPIEPNQYLFKSQKNPDMPISRVQAYRIIKQAAEFLDLEGTISCHSLRKTFGYYAWKAGVEPTLIMDVYNHSSFEVTKRYLGIAQDDKDSVYLKMNL